LPWILLFFALLCPINGLVGTGDKAQNINKHRAKSAAVIGVWPLLPTTAARLANVPGCEKLTPLSSAHDERWPRKAEKAIAEITASNRGERFRETTAMSHPRPAQGVTIVDHPFN
jgi:hypothetical protein